MKKELLLSIGLVVMVTLQTNAQSTYDYSKLCREQLNRGVVAVKTGDGKVAVSWRTLKSDPKGQAYDIYRNGKKLNANPLKTGATVKIQQNKLKDMISHVAFAVATDESRQILTGSLLEVNRSEARLVALDGFRLAMYKLFQPFELADGLEIVKAVIPGKVLNELTRILPDDEAFCSLLIDKGRMQCVFGNIRLTSVLLAGEYIDYRRILPSEFRTEALADKTSVQDAIERASLMAREGKNNLIKMSFREDTLKISSNAELGDVEEETEASLNGDPVDIAFNARYITDVIRNVPDEKLFMKFNSSVSPCVVVPQSGDDYLYLILPVRVFQ